MKVAFIINRLSEYRHFGPVIDRALASGWLVECWHNYRYKKATTNDYRFPDTKAIPVFLHGRPEVWSYHSPAELAARLERCTVDAVVATGTAQWNTKRELPARRPVWICQQDLLDTFLNHSFETLESCDLVALQTPWWTNWAAEYHAAASGSLEAAELRARLSRRVANIGSPEFDTRCLVDGDEVRRRWNIPADQPVVVLLPFPQGAGRASFWPKKIFGERRLWRRLLNVIWHRQYTYWGRALNDPCDTDVVRAVRNFCDRNGAFLLVKSRMKTPIPDYARVLADKCIYDESYYPPTIVEALSIASLCVSYYSASVLEAASVSVPNMCITYSAHDYLASQTNAYTPFRRFFNYDEGGVFQFNGVTTSVTVENAIAQLSTRALSDFVINAQARLAYMHKFIGEDDCQSASRLVDAIATCAAARTEGQSVGA